ncbi:MAG: hypothetical protein IJ365_06695 [Clostridia bacterium]|nr:hypothetical protein [Clostridia bacterium]
MIFGFCLNNEPTRPRLIISAVLILCAAVLPFLRDGNFSGGKKFLWFLLTYFMFSGSVNILSKLYSQSKDVADTLSYFFLTNVFMLAICLVGIWILYLKSRKKGNFEVIKMPLITNSFARTVLSLITSYMSIAILAMMPVSLYSVLSASLSLVGNAIVSRLVFKENMSRLAKVSFVLAMLSIVVAG